MSCGVAGNKKDVATGVVAATSVEGKRNSCYSES